MVKYCEKCNNLMKKYDKVNRLYKSEDGEKKFIKIQRYYCPNCRHIDRDLPDNLMPYKHCDKNIIKDVVSGKITPDTIGYEDYPCEMTMERWIKKYKSDIIDNTTKKKGGK